MRWTVIALISGDAMESVDKKLLFTGMLRDRWIESRNLQIPGGKSTNDTVEASLLR
jgi:hypothetical protein